MRWRSNLGLSARALSRSRWRTVLSISAVGVGIASVTVLIGAGVGAERALRAALEPLGENLLVVNPARRQTDVLRGGGSEGESLSVSDSRAIGVLPEVRHAAPVAERLVLASAEGVSLTAKLVGTTPAFEAVRNFPVLAGRFIDEQDLEAAERVVVVGALVVENLYGGELPQGETLLLNGVPFRIVGAYRKKGTAPNGSNEDELLIVPLTTAMRRLLDVDYLTRVFVQAESEEAIPGLADRITHLMRQRHDVLDGPGDFSILDQTALVRSQQQAGQTFRRVVPWVSGLALALGGVGLLAVCMLSVRERYAEIGLRLAVGGLPRDIFLQFLSEALLVSLAGGLAGLGLGAAGILAGSALTRWPMVLSWTAVVYPFGISAAIAVVFGTWPALRAARLAPIVALDSP